MVMKYTDKLKKIEIAINWLNWYDPDGGHLTIEEVKDGRVYIDDARIALSHTFYELTRFGEPPIGVVQTIDRFMEELNDWSKVTIKELEDVANHLQWADNNGDYLGMINDLRKGDETFEDVRDYFIECLQRIVDEHMAPGDPEALTYKYLITKIDG